jgi:ABC-type multidrug transport system fused ATPase/permease subunit
METRQTLIDNYRKKEQAVAQDIRKLKLRGQAFVLGELISFLLTIAFFAVYALEGRPTWALVLTLLALVAYLFTRRADGKNDRRRLEKEQLHEVYLHELQAFDGDFSAFDAGERYVDSRHPYTFDLDIFGRDSFFQRINRTTTSGGSDRLAAWLANVPADAETIAQRQRAVELLAKEDELRERFMACRGTQLADTQKLLRVVNQLDQLELTGHATERGILGLGVANLLTFYVLIVLAFAGLAYAFVPILWGLALFCAVQALASKPLKKVTRLLGQLSQQLTIYTRLFRLATSETMKKTANDGLLCSLSVQCDHMEQAMDELAAMSGTLDSRGNAFFLFMADTFALNGMFVLHRFLKWKNRYEGCLLHGIEAMSTLDALVSMATFRYDQPSTIWPKIVADDNSLDISFKGRNLRHPFLGEHAVGNDFSVADGHFYIVTGANMAGKSTFLRTVGLSYVMATAGMPVLADSLEVSIFHLFTSMRTQDDLSQGISYFNAELRRLQQLIEYVNAVKGHTLIILDEILKGTNSADKLNGSRMFLEYISKRPVSGIIATHDLELSKMEEAVPDRFHNFCFEIQLGTKVTYSYKIARGVAKNQNATYLLRNILKT